MINEIEIRELTISEIDQAYEVFRHSIPLPLSKKVWWRTQKRSGKS
ncbi:hypothetical protein [Paenibacillus sp. HJGM_3]